MRQYHQALEDILENGQLCENRTGIDTIALFGYQMRFNLSDGFPAVTTKKLAWKSVVSELLWFLEGSTDERRLAEIRYEDKRENLIGKNTIWTANADFQGKDLGYMNNEKFKLLGPVYGSQWRNFNGVDQIQFVVDQIKTNPDNRRILLSAWNPPQIDNMALPPCHLMSQFRAMNGKLNCLLFQRSADMALGIPFNIASYALLTHMIAQYCELEVGDFVHTIGDAHIYVNHLDGVKEQIKRTPLKLPVLEMPEIKGFDVRSIKKLKTSDFKLIGYEPMDPIHFDMAV